MTTWRTVSLAFVLMVAMLCTSQARAANTFILAWADDGSSALLATRDVGAYSLELVSQKRALAERFMVTKSDCFARISRLAASLRALGFTGVEARAKACNGPPETLVRTLKRHSVQALESFVTGAAPDVPDAPKGVVRYAVSTQLVLAFVPEKDGASLAAAYAREGTTYRRLER